MSGARVAVSAGVHRISSSQGQTLKSDESSGLHKLHIRLDIKELPILSQGSIKPQFGWSADRPNWRALLMDDVRGFKDS